MGCLFLLPPIQRIMGRDSSWEFIIENDILIFIYFRRKSHSLKPKAFTLEQNRTLGAFWYVHTKKVQIKPKNILKIYPERVSPKLNMYINTILYA